MSFGDKSSTAVAREFRTVHNFRGDVCQIARVVRKTAFGMLAQVFVCLVGCRVGFLLCFFGRQINRNPEN